MVIQCICSMISNCVLKGPKVPKKALSVCAFRCISSATQEKEYELVPKPKWVWEQPTGHNTGILVDNSYLQSRKPRKLVPFIVRNPSYVTWYACGPTVYNSSHVGHASTYINSDLIRRVLTQYFGLNICMVMGITNMDDKVINRALLHRRDFMELANHYEDEFKRDMKALNVLPPTTYVRVTDVIPQIIAFIQNVLNKEQAYITERGNVYFSYNSAHQSIAKLQGEFFEPDFTVTEKRFVKDIALWKSAKPGEPYWDAPWGKGRPGWHIECSAIASMCFGDKVDIHTGAGDLKFPHHEYEIAQCDAYHGCHQWVNYFLHTGQVLVSGGEKMSKSLGNFITVEDYLSQQDDPDCLRMKTCLNSWNKQYEFYQKDPVYIMLELKEQFNRFRDVVNGSQCVTVDNASVLKAVEDFETGVLSYFENNFKFGTAVRKLPVLFKTVENHTMASDSNFSDTSAVLFALNAAEVFLDNLGFTFHRR